MKLLGWMHRKFRQNSSDVPRDFGVGGTCNCLSGRPSLDEDLHRRRRQYEPFKARSLRLDAGELFDGCGGGDPTMEELVGGLLTIGTLGIGSGQIEENEEEEKDAVVSKQEEEEKPAGVAVEELVVIPAALEAIAEKEAEATTETDLMVVSAELEKVLTAEAEKGGGGGRLSSARSSHAGGAACPLQGFLFGSPIEVTETTAALVGRKERRASLGELFMISRIAEEGGGKTSEANFGGDEGKPAAEMCPTKKKTVKRRGCKGSDGGPANGSTVETKIQKILQIFHRKVHPENSIRNKKASKSGKIEKKDYVPLAAGIGNTLKGECRKENIANLINYSSNPPPHACGGSDSNSNREHWIKTDADYLVLEL